MNQEIKSLASQLLPFVQADQDANLQLDRREQQVFNRMTQKEGLGNIRYAEKRIPDEFLKRDAQIDLSEYLAWRGDAVMAKGAQRYFLHPHYQKVLDYSVRRVDRSRGESCQALAGLLASRIKKFAQIPCEDGTCQDIFANALKSLGFGAGHIFEISQKIPDPEKRLVFIEGLERVLNMADRKHVLGVLKNILSDELKAKIRLQKISPQLKDQILQLKSLGLTAEESLVYLLDDQVEIDFQTLKEKVKSLQGLGLSSPQAAHEILHSENLRGNALSLIHIKNFAKVQAAFRSDLLSGEEITENKSRHFVDISLFKLLAALPVEPDSELVLRIVKKIRSIYPRINKRT